MPQFQKWKKKWNFAKGCRKKQTCFGLSICFMNFSHFRACRVFALQRLAYSHQSIRLAHLSDITQLAPSAVVSTVDCWENKKLNIHLELNSDFLPYIILSHIILSYTVKGFRLCVRKRMCVCEREGEKVVWNSSTLSGEAKTRPCCQRSFSVTALQLKRIKRKKKTEKQNMQDMKPDKRNLRTRATGQGHWM